MAANKVVITGMGFAIGHYARWIERGAQRVEAMSNEPLVLTSAFLDEKRRRVTLVVINNAQVNRLINVNLTNMPTIKKLDVEQSSGTIRRQKLSSPPVDSKSFSLMLPAQSVITFAGEQF